MDELTDYFKRFADVKIIQLQDDVEDFSTYHVLVLLPPDHSNKNNEAHSEYVMSLSNNLRNVLAIGDSDLKMVVHSDLDQLKKSSHSYCRENTTECLKILNEQEQEKKWMVEKISFQNGEFKSSLESSLKKGSYYN